MSQKSAQAEKRLNMLQEKVVFMTNSLQKQIKEQEQHAHEIDVESKKQIAELERQREEVKLKEIELKKLDDSNNFIKEKQYEKEIEQLSRKL